MAQRLSSGLSFGLSRNLTGGWGLDVVRLMGGGRGALMGQTRGTAQIQADRIEQDVLLVDASGCKECRIDGYVLTALRIFPGQGVVLLRVCLPSGFSCEE